MPWQPPIPRGALYRPEALALGPALALLGWCYDHIERDGTVEIKLESACADIGRSYGTMRDWLRQLRTAAAQGQIFTAVEDRGRRGYRLTFAPEWVDWRIQRANYGDIPATPPAPAQRWDSNVEASAEAPAPAQRWESNGKASADGGTEAPAPAQRWDSNGKASAEASAPAQRWDSNGKASAEASAEAPTSAPTRVSTQLQRWDSNGDGRAYKELQTDHDSHHLTVVGEEAPPPPPPHPALALFLEIFPQARITQPQRAEITQAVQDLDLWGRTLREWRDAGWRPQNITRILDRYSKELRRDDYEQTRHVEPTAHPTARPAPAAARRSDAERRRRDPGSGTLSAAELAQLERALADLP